MTFCEITNILEISDDAGTDMNAEAYYIEQAIKEIEYNIAYLEDAPDEILAPYNDKFYGICERLLMLDEHLHNVRT